MGTNWPFIFALAGIFIVAAVALFIIVRTEGKVDEAEGRAMMFKEMAESAAAGRSAAWRERDEAREKLRAAEEVAHKNRARWMEFEEKYLDADKRVKELEAELSAALTTTDEWIAQYSAMEHLRDLARADADGLWRKIDQAARDLSAVRDATRRRGESVIGEDGK